ncbi:MAG: Holliday junction resolvase RuvX [Calditrichia bacterium]
MSRYLGIDYGEKRIGIAISDPTLTIAQSLKTLIFQSEKKLMQELEDIITEYAVDKIVLGLPITMKGTDSEKTREVREFAEELKKRFQQPVILFDERMTTIQAHSTLHQMGKKPGKHKEKVDSMAAQFILQTFLDREKIRGRS